MKHLLRLFVVLALCLSEQAEAQPLPTHAWQGRKVGYIGDSITDPNCIPGVKLYWEFLADWLQITPFVGNNSWRLILERWMPSWFSWALTISMPVYLWANGLQKQRRR